MKCNFALLCLLSTAMNAQDFKGSWGGELNVGVTTMRINIHINSRESGTYIGTFDSPDQGAFGLPFSSVTIAENTLECREENMNIVIKAEATGADGLEATFVQAGQSFAMQFKRMEYTDVDQRKPQDPEPPFPYLEERAFFTNKNGDTIHGTITIPEGKGKFPGVILITGSGPQNRDSEILGHRPFLVLSDYLTRRGIAVFRYDERGVGESGGDFNSATTRDFAADAFAALQHLANHKKVDPKRVGVYGHSEGGMVAAILNAEFTQPHFLILAASPGIPIPDLLQRQVEDIMRVQEMPQTERTNILERNKIIYTHILNSNTLEDARIKVNSYFDQRIQTAQEEGDNSTRGELQSVQKEINHSVLTPWFFYFIRYNPEKVLSGISVPTLIINGKTDLQVWWEDNTQAIARILKVNGNQNATVITYENLNHLFQTSESGLPLEYASIEETFNEKAMQDIAEFINR